MKPVRPIPLLLTAGLLAVFLPALFPSLEAGPPKTPAGDRGVQSPAVWIFAGLPGDPKREKRYLETVETMRRALTETFGLPGKRIHILFGAGKSSPYPACTREALFRELDRMCARSAKGMPIWAFFIGQANSTKQKVFFNLPGKDVSAGEIAAHLAALNRDCPAVFVLTTAAAGRFVAPLARRGRVLVAAVLPGREDNETEMPHILAGILAEPTTADADDNGVLTLPELVRETQRRTAAWYAEQELVPTEQLVLDGDGDGLARPLPCPGEENAAAIANLGLRLANP